jgi:hypothetical protein
VLEAYLDESERSGGIFCVAGFVFTPAAASKFNQEWRGLMGDARWPFHMVDFVAGRGAFSGITHRERAQLIRAVVALINHRFAFGVAVSCRLAEVHSVAPRWIEGFGHAYPVLCHLAMGSVGDWTRQNSRHGRPPDGVRYIFEAGHGAQDEAQRFISRIADDPDPGAAELRAYYSYESHGFQPKPALGALQAADFFAWEWAKFYDETVEQDLRPMRGSLLALLKKKSHRFQATHITGEPLRRYMEQFRQLGLAQLRESGLL